MMARQGPRARPFQNFFPRRGAFSLGLSLGWGGRAVAMPISMVGITSPAGSLLKARPPPAPAQPPVQPPTQPPPEVFRTCNNCGRDVLASNFLVHEAHCMRHFKKCEHCGKCLEVAALEAHRAEMRGSLSLLTAALEAGEAARVCSALDHGGAEVLDWRDERGASLLHLAAGAKTARDNWAMHALVADMLRLGADVSARDQLGWTPLHAAAKGGSAAVVASLVAAGADVHARGSLGASPLEVASGEETRAALLAAGAAMPGSQGSSRATSRGSSSLEGRNSRGSMSLEGRRPSTERDVSDATVAISRVDITDRQSRGAPPAALRPNGNGQRVGSSKTLVPLGAAVGARPASTGSTPSRHAQKLRAMVHAQPAPS